MNHDWLGLEDRVVVVTGGASGIGKHVVSTLLAAGAKAVVADMNVKTGDMLDGAYCVQCNVTDHASVQAMVDAVVTRFGRIDALVNNAGINLPRLLVDVKGERPDYELNDDTFNKMFDVNVRGVFLCAQACAKQMLKQGGGVIVNMSSESGKEGSQGQSVYSATKGAVDSFTRSWAKELGKYHIRVLACAPRLTTRRSPTPAAANPRSCPRITAKSSRSATTASSMRSAIWLRSWCPTAQAILPAQRSIFPAASPAADDWRAAGTLNQICFRKGGGYEKHIR